MKRVGNYLLLMQRRQQLEIIITVKVCLGDMPKLLDIYSMHIYIHKDQCMHSRIF
jgi:hypothetical protein